MVELDMKTEFNVRVSVVVPTTGRPLLSRALESARLQNGVVVEIIVVLDRPERELTVREWIRSGDRLLLTAGYAGGAAARNLGVMAATGDFVAFLDDDDWWDPKKLSAQIAAMIETASDWSWCDTLFERGGSTEVLPRRLPRRGESLASFMVTRPSLRYGDGFVQSSSLVLNRELALRSLWDESLSKHQDWDLVARLDRDEHATVVHVPEALVHVEQQRSESVSLTRSWRSSLAWFESHSGALDKRARGDFLCSVVLRSALSEGDFRGVVVLARHLSRALPHAAAVVVGLSGLAEFAKARHQRRSDGRVMK